MPTNFFNELNLYISGPLSINDSFPLFIDGPKTTDDNINLFIDGHTNSSIQLFLKTDNILEIYGNIELNTLGSDPNYTNISQKTLPLFLQPLFFNSLNLYLNVDNIGYFNYSIPLFMTSENKQVNNFLTLYLQNNVFDFTNYLTLLIKGLGINKNWYPQSNYVDMYISREYEALTNVVDLYINSSEEFNSFINLIVDGNTLFTSSIELFCSNGIIEFGETVTLYTNGFQQ